MTLFDPQPDPLSVQGAYRIQEPAVVLEAEVVEGEVKASPSDPVSELQEARADDFLSLVESGVSPTAAARELGANLAEIKRDPIIQAAAKELVEKYHFSATERRTLTRAKLNQILLTGEDKHALVAAKQIAEDPEINISGKSQPGNQVNIGIFSNDTMAVLNKLPEMKEGE